MNSLHRYVLALSRVLVSIIFLLNGLGIISQATAAKELVEYGAPAGLVPSLMLCARTIEVVAGFSLAFGVYPRFAAVALVVFLVPTTLVAHPFWQAAGTASFTVQLINFLKNTAMVGGLLFIAATPSQPTLFHALRGNERRIDMFDRQQGSGGVPSGLAPRALSKTLIQYDPDATWQKVE